MLHPHLYHNLIIVRILVSWLWTCTYKSAAVSNLRLEKSHGFLLAFLCFCHHNAKNTMQRTQCKEPARLLILWEMKKCGEVPAQPTCRRERINYCLTGGLLFRFNMEILNLSFSFSLSLYRLLGETGILSYHFCLSLWYTLPSSNFNYFP